MFQLQRFRPGSGEHEGGADTAAPKDRLLQQVKEKSKKRRREAEKDKAVTGRSGNDGADGDSKQRKKSKKTKATSEQDKGAGGATSDVPADATVASESKSTSERAETKEERRARKRAAKQAKKRAAAAAAGAENGADEEHDSDGTKTRHDAADRAFADPDDDDAVTGPTPGWMQEPKLFDVAGEAEEVEAFTARTNITFCAPVRAALQEMQVHRLFPVQSSVLPWLLESSSQQPHTAQARGDVMVCAPTGSGKTLTYLIPIVTSLHQRIVCRVRALIVLPTRELAMQVHHVVCVLAAKAGLSVALAIGHTPFAVEQHRLVTDNGRAAADIVVATPGRLLDHIAGTPGFTLQHLRYLVIDEADRLLGQTYHGWLDTVLSATYQAQPAVPDAGTSQHAALAVSTWRELPGSVSMSGRACDPLTWSPGTPVQKLLFSATLTRNPHKIAALRLSQPTLFNGSSELVQYSTPATLQEQMIVTTLPEKPLALLYLLRCVIRGQQTLCFTASVEATHRLLRLLQLYGEGERTAEYSSSLPHAKRVEVLEQFRTYRLNLLICSDVMARGIDLSNVLNVINYDVPPFIQNYIHRVGRTARAGRDGRSLTLLRREDVLPFKRMLQRAGKEKIDQLRMPRGAFQAFRERYHACLDQLKRVIKDEKLGQLDPLQPVPRADVGVEEDRSLLPATTLAKRQGAAQGKKATRIVFADAEEHVAGEGAGADGGD